MGRNVVVTGGAGFIGSNLVRTLRAAPEIDRITVLDDLSSGDRANLEGVDAVELVVGSILDADVLDAVVRGADVVVHLAAEVSVPRSVEDPAACHETNATGTVRVLEAARRHGGPQTIVASSSAVYGSAPVLPKSEDLPVSPPSPYAVSKVATEQYALAYGACYDLPTLAFRFFNVYGPYQPAGHAYAAVVPAFLDAALAGRAVTIHGDGEQTRDFVFVGSVTQAIVDAILRGVTHPEPVNLAFGTRASLLELLEAMEDVLGEPIERVHTEPRAGDVRHSQADDRRFRELFPDLTPVSLHDGLEATVAWFRNPAPPIVAADGA